MAQHDGLQTRIESRLSTMSQGQKRLARFILDNPHYVAFASTREVSRRVDVSAATIVRFCQALGYEGYADFRASVRQDLPSYSAQAERIERHQIARFDEADLFRQVMDTSQQNIARTNAQVDPARFRAAVAALTQARSIVVVGGGVSASAALFFGYSLRVLDYDVRLLTGDNLSLAVELAHLRPEDVVVGISIWRYVRQTISALRWARARAATRIAITDSPISPLAQLADYSFSVGTQAVSHSVSLIGIMAVLDAFIAALSHKNPDRTARVLREIEAAFHDSQILVPE